MPEYVQIPIQQITSIEHVDDHYELSLVQVKVQRIGAKTKKVKIKRCLILEIEEMDAYFAKKYFNEQIDFLENLINI